MKSLKNLPPPNKSDRRWLVASLIIFIGSLVLVILASNSRNNVPRPALDINGNMIDPPQGTLVPGVSDANELIRQLTALPSAAPLTGPLADEIHDVSQMVANCPDYSDARRAQMNQHIAWLLQPSTLTKDVIIALGTNINGRLLLGMATYTLADWGQHAKAADSCLVGVGKKLNEMLAANGETPLAEFSG
ncbi:MAG: hypothetical protein GC179_12145 [Anaerolineaceae bacterium]|nr:hypothetical protein [Anaerolineaceae bacterium]